MNTRHMIAAAALALTGVAASASPTVFTDMPSTMSRAEVRAEIEQARAEGLLLRHNDAYGAGDARDDDVSASATTREEVLAELEEARRSGEFDVRGEVYGDLAWTQFGNIEQPLPEQAGSAAGQAATQPDTAAGPVMSSYQPAATDMPASSDMAEPVVLWVPLDGEAITLQPGDAVMLVPAEQSLDAPDAEE
jgi:Domain of unknown function (DUF4148)